MNNSLEYDNAHCNRIEQSPNFFLKLKNKSKKYKVI